MRPHTPRLSYRVLSALAQRMPFKALVLGSLVPWFLVPSAHAAQWADVATISSTVGNTLGYLCTGGGKTDLGCPLSAPYLNPASGRLGIGTTTPSTTLHVVGTIGIGSDFSSLPITPSASLYIRQANDVSSAIVIQRAGGSITGGMYVDTGNFIVQRGLGKNLVMNSTGSVGVNGTAPSTALHVSGTLRIANGGEACDTSRLGAIRYTAGSFDVCRNTTNGWEPLSTSTSSTTPSISTGLSGSIVFRDELGYLKANNTFSISSTTGSVGVGAGAPASLGNDGLYAAGRLQTGSDATIGANLIVGGHVNMTSGRNLSWTNSNNSPSYIGGSSTSGTQYIAFYTLANEALRIVSTGFVGIGTTTPSFTLHVYDSTTGYGTGINANNLSFSRNGTNYIRATAGELAFTTGGNNIRFNIGSSGLTYFTNSVLIGGVSTTPSTTLHVSGTLRIANGGESCDTSRLGAIRYTAGSFDVCRNTTNGWEPLSTSTSSTTPSIDSGLSGSIVFRDELGYLKANNTFSISSTTGSVGIGAGAPAQVGNDGLYATGIIRSSILVTAPIVYGTNFVYVTGGPVLAVSGGVPTIRPFTGATTDALSFATSSTEALRIVSTGYVGIGTSTPGYLLHVNDASAGYGIGIGGNSLNFTRNGVNYIGAQNTNGEIRFRTGGATDQLTITSSGLVGIGTTTPSSTLHLSGGLSGVPLFRMTRPDTTSEWSFAITGGGLKLGYGTSANTAMYVSNSSVLINGGTIAPSATLHVSGTLRIANGLEACDADRLGAIRYSSGSFDICRNTTNGWEPLATAGANSTTDRIISGTTQVITYQDASLSLVTSNTERLVIGKTGNVAIGQQPNGYKLAILGGLYLDGTPISVSQTTGNLIMNGRNAGANEFKNIALGTEALRQNSNGTDNIAIGYYARYGGTGGSYNIAVGSNALYTSAGSSNIAIGIQALQKTITSLNTAVGGYVGQYTTGRNNALFGYSAGKGVDTVSTYSGVTALGTYAGQGLTTGTSNTLIGYNSGGGLTTGSNNIVIGTDTSPFSNTGDNQLNIGNSIFGDLGDAANLNAKIGINVTSPTQALEVSGTVKATVAQLGTNGKACNSTQYNTIKVENGKMYLCRQ